MSVPSDPLPSQTACCIAGGGPGGVMLALLLARQGVDVTLLESHHDFDRDFRGDTVHPVILEALDACGLADGLLAEPHAKIRQVDMVINGETYTIGSFRLLPGKFDYIAMIPQVRFLTYVVAEARKRYPSLKVVMGASAGDLIEENGRVTGLKVHHEDQEKTVKAALVVGADGRGSRLRRAAGYELEQWAPPMDVLWFRLPNPGGIENANLRVGRDGHALVVLDRGDEVQAGFIIAKKTATDIKREGVEAFKEEVLELEPKLRPVIGGITDWGQIAFLGVQTGRIVKWWKPGLLLIGDAAHVMSPVGGIGISYAVQDAIAAARILGPHLTKGEAPDAALAAVQERREKPVRIAQNFQAALQKRLVMPILSGNLPKLPVPFRILAAFPPLRFLPAWFMGYGFRSEKVDY
jgi:2-polyprenyl-6-methoxyphenol hydroxylase-like FAD-dependent oxidoreductase